MFSWRLLNRVEARHHGWEQHIRCRRFQQFRGHHSGCWNLVMRVSRTRPTRFFRAELVMVSVVVSRRAATERWSVRGPEMRHGGVPLPASELNPIPKGEQGLRSMAQGVAADETKTCKAGVDGLRLLLRTGDTRRLPRAKTRRRTRLAIDLDWLQKTPWKNRRHEIIDVLNATFRG